MARLFTSGFELQSLTAGVEFSSGAIGTGQSIVTSTKHSGAASMRVNGSLAAAAASSVGHTPATNYGGKVFFQYYLNITALKEADGVLYFKLCNAGGVAAGLDLQITKESGVYTMHIYYNDYASELVNTAVITTGTQLRIEVQYDATGAGATDTLQVKMNGTQVATTSAITLSSVATVVYWEFGRYNQGAGADTETDAYFDDIVFDNTAYPGGTSIAVAVPTGAGDNAATTGTASMIGEIPPSDTATTGVTMVELDSNAVIADYNVTDTSTLGIGSGDTIKSVNVLARVREEAAGTSSYQLRIKSASGGTVTSTTAADAGNATARTNPNGTAAFGRPLLVEVDPTTGIAWTPTGTNSIDNMQCGATNVDADSTPDLWILGLYALIEYIPAAVVAANPNMLMFFRP